MWPSVPSAGTGGERPRLSGRQPLASPVPLRGAPSSPPRGHPARRVPVCRWHPRCHAIAVGGRVALRVSMGTPEGRGQARGGSGVSPEDGQGVRAPGADGSGAGDAQGARRPSRVVLDRGPRLPTVPHGRHSCRVPVSDAAHALPVHLARGSFRHRQVCCRGQAFGFCKLLGSTSA